MRLIDNNMYNQCRLIGQTLLNYTYFMQTLSMACDQVNGKSFISDTTLYGFVLYKFSALTYRIIYNVIELYNS